MAAGGSAGVGRPDAMRTLQRRHDQQIGRTASRNPREQVAPN
jgi:hypothetical protein